MSHPEPPQSRISGTTTRIAGKQAQAARGRLYGPIANITPRKLARVKTIRNWLEVELPRTPEKSKGLAVLNQIIDAIEQSHKS